MIKIGFLMVVVGKRDLDDAHGFVLTGAKLVAELELPSTELPRLDAGENSAAFTLVFVTVVNL